MEERMELISYKEIDDEKKGDHLLCCKQDQKGR